MLVVFPTYGDPPRLKLARGYAVEQMRIVQCRAKICLRHEYGDSCRGASIQEHKIMP
jgi:hypothetical protein